jgi:hypothetical protein
MAKSSVAKVRTSAKRPTPANEIHPEPSGVHSKPSDPAENDHLGPAETLELLRYRAVLAEAVDVLKLATDIFQTGQEVDDAAATSILRNALRCASDDIEALELLTEDGADTDCGNFIRARFRCRFAIALSKFEEKHGLLTTRGVQS